MKISDLIGNKILVENILRKQAESRVINLEFQVSQHLVKMLTVSVPSADYLSKPVFGNTKFS